MKKSKLMFMISILLIIFIVGGTIVYFSLQSIGIPPKISLCNGSFQKILATENQPVLLYSIQCENWIVQEPFGMDTVTFYKDHGKNQPQNALMAVELNTPIKSIDENTNYIYFSNPEKYESDILGYQKEVETLEGDLYQNLSDEFIPEEYYFNQIQWKSHQKIMINECEAIVLSYSYITTKSNKKFWKIYSKPVYERYARKYLLPNCIGNYFIISCSASSPEELNNTCEKYVPTFKAYNKCPYCV